MENNGNLQEELSCFRQQWRQELQQQQQLPEETACTSDSPPPRNTAPKAANEDIENKAKILFLTGVSLEQKGRIPEAVRYYRQAIQLLPDIESRISDFNELAPKAESCHDLFNEDLRDDDDDDGDDDDDEDDATIHFEYMTNISDDLLGVVKEFDKLSIKGICEPEFPTTRTHISALPAELLMFILKWVVSTALDLKSLEQLSRVSHGFYALARDPELWHLVCARIWGSNVGSPLLWDGCWRKMFLERSHVLYNGVYISKISYVRPSEPTLQQQYIPYQLIVYYRYLRFFMDGTVLFHTSSEEPQSSISHLSQKIGTQSSVWNGNFKLVGNKVVIIVQRQDHVSSGARRRGRRQVATSTERVFQMELQLQNTKKKRNNRLTWMQYTCQTFYRATGQTTVSQFDLNNQFNPFYFSRVRSFEMPSSAPLGLGRP